MILQVNIDDSTIHSDSTVYDVPPHHKHTISHQSTPDPSLICTATLAEPIVEDEHDAALLNSDYLTTQHKGSVHYPPHYDQFGQISGREHTQYIAMLTFSRPVQLVYISTIHVN